MPDITMCRFTACPVKEFCYRYTATPTPHWQAYFAECPGKMIDGKWTCGMYWGENAQQIYEQLQDIVSTEKVPDGQ